MKILFATTAVLAMTTFAQAAETKPYVSSTFQDILSRVSRREPESKAIMTVRAKPDAYFSGNYGLNISMTKEELGGVVITLF